MEEKILVAAVAVMITRDPMTILPRVVARHELPILQTVFGEENVRELDDQSEAVPISLDAEGEVARMELKYGEAALEATHGKAYKSAITQAMQANVVQPEAGKKSKAAA